MRAYRLAARGALAGAAIACVGAVAGIIADRADERSFVLMLVVLGIAAFGFLCGYLAFRNPGRAVAAVSDAADRFAAGELGQRATIRSPATGQLTDAFNSMSGRVQALVEDGIAERARLEAVFDAATDPMIAISREGMLRFLNPAAADLFGVSREEAINRPFIESARDYELDALVRGAISAPGERETSVITFGPRRAPLRAVAVPIAGGGDWAVLLVLNDLTEVQRVDQVRRDFLSNVSHELRTPLASIRAMVETLEDGGLDDRRDAEEFLTRIRQQVDRLTALVNELLDLSRIESGAIDLHPEQIDAAALIAEAASLLGHRADSERVRIVCPSQPGPVFVGDRPSLLRVVSNLLDNAIKFSPPDGEVRAEAVDEGDLIALSVTNEGEGIAEGDLPRVFERFYKGDQSRSQGGVGLGLAIVKHVVRIHGGTAVASSEPGHGARFTVRLPREFVGTARGRARTGG